MIPIACFIVLNPFLAWWHYIYVQYTVHPLSYASKVLIPEKIQAEFTGIAIIGFFLILINALVGGPTLIILYNLRPQASRVINSIYWFFFSLAFCGFIFGTFAQFVSPFITSRVVWKSTYKDACNRMGTRVYLDSAPGQPARDVEFVDMTSGGGYDERVEYSMRMVPNLNTPWGVVDGGVYNFTVSPKVGETVLIWDTITYDLGAKTFDILAGNKSILYGEFRLGKDFSIPVLGLRGDLSWYTKGCVFDPTAKIYDNGVALNRGDAAENRLVMKTVQFDICDRLQVCADSSLGGITALPVGLLILQRAARGNNRCCKGIYLPGVEGRG